MTNLFPMKGAGRELQEIQNFTFFCSLSCACLTTWPFAVWRNCGLSKENGRRLLHFSRVPNPFRKNNLSRPGKFHVSLPLVSRFFPPGCFSVRSCLGGLLHGLLPPSSCYLFGWKSFLFFRLVPVSAL